MRQKEPCYGRAVRAGFGDARAPSIVAMDGDLSNRPVFLEEFWRRREEAEVLTAFRDVERGQADVGKCRRLGASS